MFNGRLKITICGAKELQLTNCMVRLKDALTLGGSGGAKDKPKDVSTLDPYVAIDVDHVSIERTSTKGEHLEILVVDIFWKKKSTRMRRSSSQNLTTADLELLYSPLFAASQEKCVNFGREQILPSILAHLNPCPFWREMFLCFLLRSSLFPCYLNIPCAYSQRG